MPRVCFGSKADIKQRLTDVRFTPKSRHPSASRLSALCQKQTFCAAAKMTLFDHLVGAGEQGLGH
jgi:hypothetical protein